METWTQEEYIKEATAALTRDYSNVPRSIDTSTMTFKERYKYLKEERIKQDKFFYHVSPENELILKDKGLFVTSRLHGIVTYNFASRNSDTASVWKLKPTRGLDIFNLFNKNDIKELKYELANKKIDLTEIRNASNYIFDINLNWEDKKYKFNEKMILDLLDSFENNKTPYRDHRLFEILCGLLYITGSDGWAEDSFVTKNPLTTREQYFAKGSIFVFDAKDCFEIVEKMDSALLNSNELFKEAIKAGYPPVIK